VVFTALTMKNAVLSDVMPCGNFKKQRFGGTSFLTKATRHNILGNGILHI
jgi:hypothetical protein